MSPKQWEHRIKKRREKFIPSNIDLYPCYEGRQARVVLTPLTNGDWRCCIWGADDFGFDFDTADYDVAKQQYDSLTRLTVDPVKAGWPGWVRA